MKWKYTVLGVLEFFVAFGALPAGIAMLMETDGSGLGMPLEMLEETPFKSFLIPGLFLVFVHGLGSVLGGVLSFRKHRYAGLAGLFLGTALILWIAVQVYFIGLTFFLQWLFFIVGLAEVFLAYRIYRSNT